MGSQEDDDARGTDRGHPRLPGPFVFVDDVFSLRIYLDASTRQRHTKLYRSTEIQAEILVCPGAIESAQRCGGRVATRRPDTQDEPR
jgi:hypothetical protein